MLRIQNLGRAHITRLPSRSNKSPQRFASSKVSDPLRILFCGSDDFSTTSLSALHRLYVSEPDVIRSIDVVCRTPKVVGRGLKHVREVQCSSLAKDLGLPLHHIDTFRGWNPPSYDVPADSAQKDNGKINLVVAVSFGLLVPPRILGHAKYGGLNIHASLLPDFRGAAPIERALLAGCTQTGVTLQTLHPTKMDHGQILLQSGPWPFEIPRPDSIRPAELRALLAPLGALMLKQGIRNGLHVPPVEDRTPSLSDKQLNKLRRAPKILPEDQHIRWTDWTADEILRRHRVIGPLWNNIVFGDETVRVTFSHGFSLREGDMLDSTIPIGTPLQVRDGHATDSSLRFKTVDGKLLSADLIKVPGYGEKAARWWARKTHLFGFNGSQDTGNGAHATFRVAANPLV